MNTLQIKKAMVESYISRKPFPDEKAARRAFNKAKEKLFDIKAWNEMPGIENALFIMYNKEGQCVDDETPDVGYFIKTILPGDLPADWVKIVDVCNEERDYALFTIQSCKSPVRHKDGTSTRQLFHHKTKSTFKIQRTNKVIIASGEGESLTGKRKNICAFVQKVQWENVLDHITKEI